MKRLTLSTTILIYLFLINILINIVSFHFSMVEGYNKFQDIEFTNSIFTIILCLLTSLALPIKSLRPSEMILWTLYFMHYVPSVITYPYLSDKDVILWPIIMTFIFVFVSLLVKIKIPKLKTRRYKYINEHLFISCLGLIFLMFIIQEHGFNITPPNITDVYGVREAYKSNLSWIGGYIIVIAGFSVAPFLMLLSWIYFKKRSLVFIPTIIISLLISYSIYAASGLKSIAFASFISLFIYILLQKFKSAGAFFVIFFTSITIFSLVIYFIFNIDIVAIHWVRRALITPGMNVSYYYEYFTTIGTPWANAPHLISNLYYGTDGSANSGLFGSSISQYGWGGLIINPLILLIILKMADNSSNKADSAFATALFFMTAYALSNSATTTVFFTYGFVANILLLRFFSSDIK